MFAQQDTPAATKSEPQEYFGKYFVAKSEEEPGNDFYLIRDSDDETTDHRTQKGIIWKKAGLYCAVIFVTAAIAYTSYQFRPWNTMEAGLTVRDPDVSHSLIHPVVPENTNSEFEDGSDNLLFSEQVSLEGSEESSANANASGNQGAASKPLAPNVPTAPSDDHGGHGGEVNPPPSTIPDDSLLPPPAPPLPEPPSHPETSDNENPGTDTVPADTVTVKIRGNTVTMDAQQAVAGWVATEINHLYPKEAIKAQAVAAYTYIKYYNLTGQTPVIGYSDTPHDNIKQAVHEVRGQMVYSGNRLAFTPWFAMSIGVTMNSEQVWGGTVSNLRSVSSDIEKGYTDGYSNYQTTVTFSADAVRDKLQSVFGITLSSNPANWFQILSYHQTTNYNNKTIGYVNQVSIDGQVIQTGRYVRESLLGGLEGKAFRSTAFDAPVYNAQDNTLTFTVYGYGHGCGMSQTGAKLYANIGWSYQKILTHYYSGVTIQ